MLGKTNLLFIAEDEAAELAFKPEYILTSSSGNILKIEYINNLFFAFTSDNKVLYGSDVNNLQTLKKDGTPFSATHIIYKDNAYYMVTSAITGQNAIVYKTSNLSSYEEIIIRTKGDETESTYEPDYRSVGIFLTNEEKIVVLYYNNQYDNKRLRVIIIDSFENFDRKKSAYHDLSIVNLEYGCNKIVLLKDRIFCKLSTNNYMSIITLDGYIQTVDEYQYFALDYFFKKTHYVSDSLYYSLNGVDYIHIPFDKQINVLNIFEHDGSIAMIYTYEEGDSAAQHFTTAATPKDLTNAINSSIPVSIDYTMQTGASLYKDGYSYLGCSGGIIIKGQIDNAEVIRPDVVVVKGMAAKEALRQANDYTDEKYKNTTKEVKEIEETTRQYMENVFSATPEGYAELVDTVHENTAKIGIITEKAELNIKETAIGETIRLTDSDDKKVVEFALYGKAKQTTTIGKNLLENKAKTQTVDGVTFTVNNDKSISLSGTATKDINFIINDNLKIPAGNYKSSVLGGNASIFMYIHRQNSDDSWNYGITNSYSNPNLSVSDDYKKLIVGITVKNGTNVNGTVIKPMIRLASISDDTWEPYTGGTAAPNPEYPQDIDISGNSGSVKVVSCGKNLKEFDLEIIKGKNTVGTWEGNVYTRHGGKLKFNNDGSIEVDGTFSESTTCFVGYIHNLDIESNYILSGSPYRSDNSPSTNLFRLDIRGSDGMNVRAVNHSGESEFLPAEETHTCYIRFDKNTTINKLIFYPMVSEEGGEYEPYKESSSTITVENGLPGIPVESVGNYTDADGQQWICDVVVKYADGSGEKIQRIGIVENYNSEAITGAYISTTGELSTGAKVIYQLSEPIRTPLTSEQVAEIEKLSTFHPITHITNDGGCEMRITYLADSKNYIDRKVAEQVASIVENMK